MRVSSIAWKPLLVRFARSSMALFALAACSRPSAETATGGDAVSTVAWSPDRFGLQATSPGELSLADAYWMARISQIASHSADEVPGDLRSIGLANAEWAFYDEQKTNTQALYVSNNDFAILAFRGTEQVDDLITDGKVKRDGTLLGSIHHGFREAFLSVWEDDTRALVHGTAVPGQGLRTLLSQHQAAHPGAALYFTGHSLGGALATIAFAFARFAACFTIHSEESSPLSTQLYAACAAAHQDLDVHDVYTFGAPRPGDRVFAGLVAGDGIWSADRPFLHRFVNDVDLVPSLLSRVPGGFWHPQRGGDENATLLYLPAAGPMRPRGPVAQPKKGQVKVRTAEHRIVAYIDKLLEDVAPGAVVALPDPPDPLDALAAEYLAADPSTFEPIDPLALEGDARAALDASPPGSMTAYRWRRSAPLYELRETPSARRHATLYDDAFRLVVSIAELDDPSTPDGTSMLVLGPDDAPVNE